MQFPRIQGADCCGRIVAVGDGVDNTRIGDNVVRYIEQDRVVPFVARTYPLGDIVQAQEDFLAKKYPGKLVLIPPEQES